MSLTLHYHPLSSFCWKTLIALYENETTFIPYLVNLGEEKSRGEFLKIAPMGQFPVLQDDKRKQIIPQSSVIIEYLHLYYPGPSKQIPTDPELALEARRGNEFYDTYIHVHIQKVVGDSMRSPGTSDLVGVAHARKVIRTAYDVLEKKMKDRTWSVGEAFTMADSAAAPALFYGNIIEPFEDTHKHLARYFSRLKTRPTFARVLKEAEPYFHLFPYQKKENPSKNGSQIRS